MNADKLRRTIMKLRIFATFMVMVFVFGFLLLAFCRTTVFTQSGRKDAQTSSTPNADVSEKETPEANSSDQNLETVRFLVAGNLSRFVEQLNEFGKSGYRVDKAFNFGGDAATYSQSFAAVLRLENGNKYEYDWLTSPNKDFLESRLNYKTESGFYPIQTFGITACGDKSFDSDKDDSIINSPVLRLNKGDVFLLERKNGIMKKPKNYKVFVAKIGIGKNPSKELQSALDNVSKEYRPFKILFNRDGFIGFSVSVLLEDDLNEKVSRQTDYKFVKAINGFEKEINSLANTGYKFLSGRRIGLIKYAVMAKDSDEAVAYKFVDEEKYEKDMVKMIKSDDIYHGHFIGDSECDSPKTIGGKLVFEQSTNVASKNKDYKYIHLTTKKTFSSTDETISEINKLLSENYEAEDIFYSNGVVLILTK